MFSPRLAGIRRHGVGRFAPMPAELEGIDCLLEGAHGLRVPVQRILWQQLACFRMLSVRQPAHNLERFQDFHIRLGILAHRC